MSSTLLGVTVLGYNDQLVEVKAFAPGQTRVFRALLALPDNATILKVEIASFRDLEMPVR
ncbi:hypothetical protein [Streptosporangium sp. NPDC000396]|uniref:hypothetical protein n=1 Tax=Streptosporangium sp. NPDC000396 TaxID=3366185 RepID=UPI0036BA4A4C